MADNFLNLTGLQRFKNKLDALFNGKQDTLVSGTNIKTILGVSILGSGNVSFPTTDTYPNNLSSGDIGVIIESSDNNAAADIIINDSLLQYDDAYFPASKMRTINDAGVGEIVLPGYDYVNYRIDEKVDQDYVDTKIAEEATDTVAGTVKLNSSESVTLNANGQLVVGGRLGQFPNGGVFYPTTIEPTNVGGSTFLMTDGAKYLSLGPRTFGIMAGINLTCKSAAAGTTQYRLSNNQSNRFSCFACRGGRLAIDQTDATENGTALMTDISFANGDPIRAYFGPTESSNDIIITVDRTVNPSASTTKLRMYGTSTASDVIIVGQGNGASGGKAISLGQACHAGGNQCIAFGNSSLSLANNSVVFGHTNLVNKQFCFCAGQGHDFTNGSNGAGAVGICSEISSDTAFAVGNGVFNANGNITRSNAFEVRNDGSIVMKSPNGTRYKVAIDNNGIFTTTAI